MDQKQLDYFLGDNPQVNWKVVEDGILFRHEQFDGEDEATKFSFEVLKKIEPSELKKILVSGRNVSQYTRITGYFSKVENWNKGKRGELKDRAKIPLDRTENL